jgi:soluble lytic murein transglycosylase-like protein
MKQGFALFVLIPLFSAGALLSSCSASPTPPTSDSALAELNSLSDKELTGYIESLDRKDPIAPYYKNPSTREDTLQFFSSLTRSENVARVILDNADKFGVRPSLAFALALEESDFRVDAINRNGDSVDRGLFQLNSKSYPGLGVRDFYDPGTNARYGVSHLKSCLAQAGNEVAALAMYNAGNGRVERGATPKKTLNYVSRILAYEENISRLFAAKVMSTARFSAARKAVARAYSGAGLLAQSVGLGLVSRD